MGLDSATDSLSHRVGSAAADAVQLDYSRFADFYRQVFDQEAYPWQKRLAKRVIEDGKFPSIISLPTGSGKTAIVDIAIFALAVRPDLFPRRIVFVIDRRIVVDQVYERVTRITNAIRDGDAPILVEMKRQLSSLCDATEPIGHVSLRGGTHIDGEWAKRIDQPWVVVSTVDHFGSRLLFRGYGVSHRMRPIHAALTGNDCLVILDEVHLSLPFRDTLRSLAEFQAKSSKKLPSRFQVVEMSATTRSQSESKLGLEHDDLEDAPALRRRMHARKRAELVKVPKRNDVAKRVARIVQTINTEREKDGMRSQSGCFTVGVIVNRVRTAREIRANLEDLAFETYLVIGRMRPIDKARVVERMLPYVTSGTKATLSGFRVVVATQAIEVGADFDFDFLITECAPMDALRQRFGRLDRQGLRSSELTSANILGIGNEMRDRDTDPIYGEATKRTWVYLNGLVEEDKTIGFGPLEHVDPPRECLTKTLQSPLLLPTYMEAWVQTNPEPGVQPDVDWFLHGIDLDRQAAPEVSVVWRWDRSTEALHHIPIRQAEILDLPISAVKTWLSAKQRDIPSIDIDIQDVSGVVKEKSIEVAEDIEVHRLDQQGKQQLVEIARLNDVRPGDTVLLRPDEGGLTDGIWNPNETNTVSDFGDLSQLEYGRRVTLRLDPRVLESTSAPPLPQDELDAEEPRRIRVQNWLANYREQLSDGSRYIEIVDRLQHGFTMTEVVDDDESDSYYLLQESSRTGTISKVDDSYMSDAGELGSLTGTGVTLKSHLQGVAERTARVALSLGFSDELVEDLKLAAELHDIGKIDERFQLMLAGGDKIRLAGLEEPLAKSLPGISSTIDYPAGMRHEVSSMALLNSNLKILDQANDVDLVLHLVGSHHGWCRPFPWIAHDPSPVTMRYKVSDLPLIASSDQSDQGLALESAQRFWSLLEKYGEYGLAWLESILRLSDHLQSAEESRR